MSTSLDARLPEAVRRYLGRSLPTAPSAATTVRVQQVGEMWKTRDARAMSFRATEDFAVERVAFWWRACFPIIGPLKMMVVDEFADGTGQLRVSLFGIPLQTRTGPELNVGEAMRYLAELVWAPHAIAANRELEWEAVDERTVEVKCGVNDATASVRWDFDTAGDPVRATGVRPFPDGKTFTPRTWGGNFGEYCRVGNTRVPSRGEAWWDLPDGRFVYWRGRITASELLAQ